MPPDEREIPCQNIRCRRYNPYLGEISPVVPNLIARNFRAEKPSEKEGTRTESWTQRKKKRLNVHERTRRNCATKKEYRIYDLPRRT